MTPLKDAYVDALPWTVRAAHTAGFWFSQMMAWYARDAAQQAIHDDHDLRAMRDAYADLTHAMLTTGLHPHRQDTMRQLGRQLQAAKDTAHTAHDVEVRAMLTTFEDRARAGLRAGIG